MARQSRRYDIGGYFNQLRDSQIDSTQAINMYASVDPVTQKKTIVPASGHSIDGGAVITASNVHRASFVREDLGFAYIVVGDEVIQIDKFLAETVLGTIGTTQGYVGIDANQHEICFVDGTGAWRWDTDTSTFAQIFFGGSVSTFPQAGPGENFFPIDITNINGYLLAVDIGTSSIKWRISQLDNARDWATLDFVNFLSPGDRLAGIRAHHKRAFIFGNVTTQVWYNGVGLSDFPFLEDTSILPEHGLAAVGSLKESFEVMFYISRDKSGVSGVQMVVGTLPVKISTPAIDLALQRLTNVEEGQAILYKENGLVFYQISFTTDEKTFVYVFPDTIPRPRGTWHQLSTLDGLRHVAATQFFFDNKNFIGSYLDTKLYELSFEITSYDGDLIRMVLIGPNLQTELHKRIRIDRFEVEMVTGLLPTPVVDPADEPNLLISFSRDGGKTFGNITRHSVGNTAEFQNRVMRRNLGVLRGRVLIPKLEFPFKIPLYITGIILTYEDLSE